MASHPSRSSSCAQGAHRRRYGVWIAAVVLAVTGCGELLPQLRSVLGLDAGLTPVVAGESNSKTLAFSVTPEDEYQLLELGPGRAGEEWTLQVADLSGSARLAALVLLDEQENILGRATLGSQATLRCVLSTDTSALYAGVMNHGISPVAVRVTATVSAAEIAAPCGQLVWLNFDGAAGLVIHGRPEAAFARFDAGVLGEAYAGRTGVIEAMILETLRELYADYDVEFRSSAVDVAPTEAHATLHFGGSDTERLGFSDGVDWGNADASDEAIVYVGNLAAYESMQLSGAQMGRMIGTVAGHELGHLLGLCHTRGATSLMDESRSAWELVGESSFDVAPLAPTVFPVGALDGAAMLSQTVGLRASDRQ